APGIARYTPDRSGARRPHGGEKRVNAILAAVRGLLAFGVAEGHVSPEALAQLYLLGHDRGMPAKLRREAGRWGVQVKVRHGLVEPQTPVDRATDDEVLALLRACSTARDRFPTLLMVRAGLRRGEAVGLRREDIHFVLDASM